MSLIVDILGPLFCAFFGAFFGALVGVLYPPKSPAWARWQKIGVGLGVGSIALFAGALIAGNITGWTKHVWWVLVSGILVLVLYMIVGNTCRRYHEGANSRTTRKHR